MKRHWIYMPILLVLAAGFISLGQWIGWAWISWLGGMAIVAALGLLGNWFPMRRELARNARRFRDVLNSGTVESITWTSDEVVEFEEIEDLGTTWCFEVEPGKLFVLGGQEHYESSRFPNSECELVRAADSKGRHALYEVYCRGRKLRPARIVPISAQENLSLPLEPTLVEGRLEEVERVFSRASA